MTATLCLALTRRLAESFPNGDWLQFSPKDCIADRGSKCWSNWRPIANLDDVGGVYAILLPAVWFASGQTLNLHAPHRHKGKGIPFHLTLKACTDDGYGVVYVGRTANLKARWRGHLTPGDRKDGGQVKYGMKDCGVADDLESALRELRFHSRIVYTVLDRPEHCANRDILEMALCARFGPPFNIKSER